jgi:DNA-binding MarR family transcriptional regulator
MNESQPALHMIDIWRQYQRMGLRLAAIMSQELARTGLSEADYEILTALLESPHDSMRAISLRCGIEWEKSRLSHQLRRMEQRGLILRENCEEDNRSAIVRISENGRKLAIEAKACYEDAVQRYFAEALSLQQLQELEAISQTVLAHLEQLHPLKH